MKKRISILLVVILMFALFGCAKSSVKSEELIIALPTDGYYEVWRSIADEYEKQNEGVKIDIWDKDRSGYTDWVSQQLSAGNMTADIIEGNIAQGFFGANKFVDLLNYMNETNPYADEENTRWLEMLDESAYRPDFGEAMYMLNVDMVQAGWFYNKNLFKQAGITVDGTQNSEPKPPETFEELIVACEKLDKLQVNGKDVVPLSIGGSVNSFWNEMTGWLLRIYTDQYWRDSYEHFASLEGDYNYDAEINEKFFANYDVNNLDENFDYDFDVPEKFVTNRSRILKCLTDGSGIGPDSDRYREMYDNLAQIFPKYCAEEFFTLSSEQSATDYFLPGNAGMHLSSLAFFGFFETAMQAASEEDRFELGFFFSPPMTKNSKGGETLASSKITRSLGGPNGFLSVVNKTKEQNDRAVDFLMFYASPQGQQIRFNKMVELNLPPIGTSLVKNVTLPEKYEELFNSVGYRGNADNNPAVGLFGRGIYDEQKSLRDVCTVIQSFFKGDVTSMELSKYAHQRFVSVIPDVLEFFNMRPDALSMPAENPYL